MFSTNGIANAVSAAGPTNFLGGISAYNPYGGLEASAIFTLQSDGSVVGSIGSTEFETTLSNSLSGDTWYSPITTGIGSSYWAQATIVYGPTPNGTPVGSWESLASDLTWSITLSGTNVSSSTVLSVQISSSPTGTPVVATGQASLAVSVGSFSIP